MLSVECWLLNVSAPGLQKVAKTTLQPGTATQSYAPIMDSSQFWSIFTMPIGLLLGFGPAIVVWLKSEMSGKDKDRK
jgi:hypothetical protein